MRVVKGQRWHPTGHCLQLHNPKGLIAAISREHKQIRIPQHGQFLLLADTAMKHNGLIDPRCQGLLFKLPAKGPISNHMEISSPRGCTCLNQPIHPLIAVKPTHKQKPQGLLLVPKRPLPTFLSNLAIQPLLQLPKAAGQHEHFLRLYALLNKNLSKYR
jgi:hypothetical protein